MRIVINLHTAENLGCSDDVEPGFFGSYPAPDLQARVWLDGRVVGTTRHVQDSARIEWFEVFEVEAPSLPATFAVELREAEPGPSREQPTWVACDVAPGSEERLQVTVPLDSAVSFDSRGDGPLAGRVVGRAGPASLPHPAPLPLQVRESAHDCLHLGWTPPSGDPPGVAQTMMRDYGWHALPRGATTYDECGLTSQWPYHARLLRELDGWRVAAPEATFYTTAAPAGPPQGASPPTPGPAASGAPAAFVVQVAPGYEEVNVTWRGEGAAIARVEVHAWLDPGFPRSAWTLRAERAEAQGAVSLSASAGRPLYVSVVPYDAAGHAGAAVDASATPLARPPPPIPPAPTLRGLHPDRLVVRWDAPVTAGVARHEVLLADASGTGARRLAASVAVPALDATIVGVEAGRDYLVILRRVNENGLANDSAPVPYRHAPTNEPPRLAASFASPPRAGVAAVLEVQAVDPDGDAFLGNVSWGDGTRADLAPRVSHRFSTPGQHVVTLRAVDALGAQGERVVVVDVRPNLPPRAAFDLTPAPARPAAEVTLVVGDYVDPEGDLVTFGVDWGDGTREVVGPAATHVYPAAGRYGVTLTVTDAGGAASEASRDLVVEEPVEAAPGTAPVRALPIAGTPPATGAPPPEVEPASVATETPPPVALDEQAGDRRAPGVAPIALVALAAVLALARRRAA
jgi:hypothetical protein